MVSESPCTPPTVVVGLDINGTSTVNQLLCATPTIQSAVMTIDLNSTTPAAFSNQPPASDATWTIIPRRTRSHKYAIATSYSNPKRNHDDRKHKHETQVPRFS